MTQPAGDQLAEIQALLEKTYKLSQSTFEAIAGNETLGIKGLAKRVESSEATVAQEVHDRRESVKRIHVRIDTVEDEFAVKLEAVSKELDGKIDQIDEKLERQERRWAVLVGAVFGAGLAGGGIGAAIVNHFG